MYLSLPPSRFNGGGTLACTSGARLMPQLPTMTVVTPCEIFGNIRGLGEDDLVVMRVDVDEARRDDQTGDIDHLGVRQRQDPGRSQ